MQSYEFYWESELLSENVNKILFHFLVYITIAGESLAALFVAGECPDKIRVFHLLVDIADEGTTSEMTACNLVDMSFLLNACRGIQHCYNTVDATLCKYLFDSIVVLLRTDKWQEHTFTFNARIAFKYIFGASVERHTKHLRAIMWLFLGLAGGTALGGGGVLCLHYGFYLFEGQGFGVFALRDLVVGGFLVSLFLVGYVGSETSFEHL